jgi:hypothetical protein
MNRKTERSLFGPRVLIATCAAMAGLVSSGLTFAQAPAKAPITAVVSPWQPAPEKLPVWDMALLGKPPATQPATEVPVDGVQAIWIDTLPLQGKPTKAFAYLGMPAKLADTNEKVPGVVLVHGGPVALENITGAVAAIVDLHYGGELGGYRARGPKDDASLRAHSSQAAADGTTRTLAVLTRLPRPLQSLLLGTEYYVAVPDAHTAKASSTADGLS